MAKFSLLATLLLISGCASAPIQYEWRLQPDGSYFHCVAGTDQCDDNFRAYKIEKVVRLRL